MKKETAKKLLRIIGIIIYICAAFTILTGVLMIAIKMPDEVINEVKNLIGNADLQGLNPIKVFGSWKERKNNFSIRIIYHRSN